MIHEQIENPMSSIVAYIAARLKNPENENYSMSDQRAKHKGMRRMGDRDKGIKLLHDLTNVSNM